jgi:hypothetical protein
MITFLGLQGDSRLVAVKNRKIEKGRRCWELKPRRPGGLNHA